MRMYLISDNVDTLTGMRLAGIEGIVVHERAEIIDAIDAALKMQEVGIILMTELCAERVKDVVADIKLNYSVPLVVEVPDRHGTRRPADYIMRHVQEAIGLKL